MGEGWGLARSLLWKAWVLPSLSRCHKMSYLKVPPTSQGCLAPAGLSSLDHSKPWPPLLPAPRFPGDAGALRNPGVFPLDLWGLPSPAFSARAPVSPRDDEGWWGAPGFIGLFPSWEREVYTQEFGCFSKVLTFLDTKVINSLFDFHGLLLCWCVCLLVHLFPEEWRSMYVLPPSLAQNLSSRERNTTSRASCCPGLSELTAAVPRCGQAPGVHVVWREVGRQAPTWHLVLLDAGSFLLFWSHKNEVSLQSQAAL